MATINTAQAKWERKTANAGENWKRAVNGAGGRYAEGLRAFGASPGPQTTSAFEQGVSAVSASDFQQAVSGKGAKWRENFLRGVSK